MVRSAPKAFSACVSALQKFSGLRVAAHLTCVDACREETLEIATSIPAVGVADIVALRGDHAKGQTRFRSHPKGFKSSIELISALAKTSDFTLREGPIPKPIPKPRPPAPILSFSNAK
tara:strand:- start:671 stop:1024 length:354 start_codon:yes stop_codon:yes gene_type:complete